MVEIVDGDSNESGSNNQQKDNHGITDRDNRRTTGI